MKHFKMLFWVMAIVMAANMARAGVPIEIPPAQLRVIQKSAMEQKKAMDQFQEQSKEYGKELMQVAKEFAKTEPGSRERHEIALKLTDKYVDVLSKMVDPLVNIDNKFAAMQRAIDEAKKKARPLKNHASFEEQKKTFNAWLDVTQQWIDKGAFKNSRRIQKALKGIRNRILVARVHGSHFTDDDLDAIGENILSLRLEIRNYAKAMKELLRGIVAARQEGTRRRIENDLDTITMLFDQGIVNQWINIGPEVLDAIVEVPQESNGKNRNTGMEEVDLRSLRIQ